MTPGALLLDFGGVLTPSVGRQFRDFEQDHTLPKGTIFRAMAEAYGDGGDDSDIARLERGELPVTEFEARLAASFTQHGFEVPGDGLIARLFTRMRPDGRIWEATRRLRETGVATAVLSNSWGVDAYPQELMADYFDDVVISAEVGLRKPDPAIFRLAAERLEVAVEACVFVDDLDLNVAAARAVGLTAIHHDGDEDRVLGELSKVFGVDVTDVESLTR